MYIVSIELQDAVFRLFGESISIYEKKITHIVNFVWPLGTVK